MRFHLDGHNVNMGYGGRVVRPPADQGISMKPVLQAILLADRVYEDKTGKKIIAGTFNRVFLNRTANVPIDHPTDSTKKIVQGGTDIGSPSVYISLTDLVPAVDITMRLVNVSKNQMILECPVKIQCPDRLATVEIVVPLPPLGRFVTEAGTYTLDLVWKEELLGSHRITAEEIINQNQEGV